MFSVFYLNILFFYISIFVSSIALILLFTMVMLWFLLPVERKGQCGRVSAWNLWLRSLGLLTGAVQLGCDGSQLLGHIVVVLHNWSTGLHPMSPRCKVPTGDVLMIEYPVNEYFIFWRCCKALCSFVLISAVRKRKHICSTSQFRYTSIVFVNTFMPQTCM